MEGTALAYEGHFYWENWGEFLGAPDERGIADYVRCGCVVLKTKDNHQLEPNCRVLDAVGVPYRHLNAEEIVRLVPVLAMEAFCPPKKIDDPRFGEANDDPLIGAPYPTSLIHLGARTAKN